MQLKYELLTFHAKTLMYDSHNQYSVNFVLLLKYCEDCQDDLNTPISDH